VRPRYLAPVSAVAAFCFLGCDGELRGAKHLVLISLDTTRADQLGCYGNTTVRTPEIDRLARESIVLDDYMTVAPTTLASHVSLFTGRYPQAHGTPRNGFTVNAENVMLPEILEQHGFTTAGFIASFALHSRFDFAQGFEHWDESFDRLAGMDGRLQNERSAESVNRAVIDWLDAAGVPERLFLFVHYFDPHAPYAAPPPFDTMYDPRGREGLPAWQELRTEEFVQLPEDEVSRRTALQYAGEISYLDREIGVLLEALRARGILDQALVVVTSDHGEDFWEHPVSFDHGWTTYQTTMRGVGLVRLPGARHAGLRQTGLVASVDILPSVLAFLGLPAPPGIDGEALDLTLPSHPGLQRARFGQATKPWQVESGEAAWRNLHKARCVREGPFKLIQVPYRAEQELYDLSRDPLEQTNLLADAGPELRELATRLGHRLEAWAASARPLPSRFAATPQDDTLERLRALGYVGGDGP
jgi:arylsulfatase A-like enzyme